MLNLLWGFATLAFTVLALRFLMPVDGKMNSRIKPWIEPYLAIAFTSLFVLGLGLIVEGMVALLS